MEKMEYLEYRDEPLRNILDIKGLRKAIKNFKEENAVEVLRNFLSMDGDCPKFLPISPHEDVTPIDSGTQNVGIFSTALCLETIAAYQKNVDECKKSIDGSHWVWEREERRKGERRITSSPPEEERRTKDRRGKETKSWGKEKAYGFFRFIMNGLDGSLKVDYGFLAKVATLVRFSNYLDHWGIKDKFIEKIDDNKAKEKFVTICLDCILEFHNRLSTKKESIHPFELFRFLQFVEKWGTEIWYLFENKSAIEKYFSTKDKENQGESIRQRCQEFHKRLITLVKKKVEGVDREKVEMKSVNIDFIKRKVREVKVIDQLSGINGLDAFVSKHRIVFEYFYDEVYLFAKYELYRQMSLKQSGDSKLYDPKRLIYSLLIVYLDNRFSNTLVRNKALDLIFSPYREDKNAAWSPGQQVAMSKDGLMIITDNECVCDLLGCEALKRSLLGFINELKYIYDGYARTKRVENGKILGWYPTHQRDKTPTSWTTAFTLSFIKRFCKLLSLELSRKAKERFRSNYRKADIDWEDIYDSTAVKAKIRLMFPRDYDPEKGGDVIEACKYRTAILFGPPGTGKTTYGRALAKKLDLDYLELTPGDFFGGGEDSILVTINDIFEHLLHLENTVVFIDEIDDLVKNRSQNKDQPFDRRNLFVNSLLPRFQELHDNQNIILLMATNNIEGVDNAILRMGRVDLVIPVGAISPHGRLKYWYEFQEKHKDIFKELESVSPESIELDIAYLNAMEAFNFSTLKHYSDLIVDEIKKNTIKDKEKIRETIGSLLGPLAEKKSKDDALLIRKNNVMGEKPSYDTRPAVRDEDFDDFDFFSSIGYPHPKREFQEAFVALYRDLREAEISKDKAIRIKDTIVKYCNDFDMRQGEGRDAKCVKRFYNIMTPFYDDIEDAIRRVTDREARAALIFSRGQLMELVYGRNMLAS